MPTETWFGHESAAFLRSPRPKLRRCLSCLQADRFNPNIGHWGEWEEIGEEETESSARDCAAEEFPQAS